ncbi:MAG: hypothetical protein AB7T10_09545 [bacterium]
MYCVFCEKKSRNSEKDVEELYCIHCRRCGSYRIDIKSYRDFKVSSLYKSRHFIISIIKEINCSGRIPTIGFANELPDDGILTFEKMISMYPKSIEEKIERITTNLKRRSEEKKIITLMKNDYAFYYSEDEEEMKKIKSILLERDLIDIKRHEMGILSKKSYRYNFFEDICIKITDKC